MDSKIAELTDKLLKEGVEKGEEQAKQIVENASLKASQIVSEAKKEAGEILAKAKSQAEEMKRNAASEIKLSGEQALSAIRQEILDIIVAAAINDGIDKTLDDPAVIKDLILTVAQNWKAGTGQEISLEILLPESKRQEMEKNLTHALHKQLRQSVTISFSKGISAGFRIGPAGGAYKVSLTDEDFKEFFKTFLRPKARALLFGEK